MSSERLWSPQMRKWAKDAHIHGIQIGFARTGTRQAGGDGGGGGVPYLERMTDDEGLRVIDSPLARFDYAQPRRIDYPTSHRGPSPPLLVPLAPGINTSFKVKVAGQTVLTFGGKGMKI